jgi:hypothetical protein
MLRNLPQAQAAGQCGGRRLMEQIKPMDLSSWRGANRSDSRSYRED